MAQSLCQIYIHLIFSTKNRVPYLTHAFHDPLRAYLGGILRNLKSPSLSIGNANDHIHILYVHNKNILITELIKQVKADSSKWLKTQDPSFDGFSWQTGYGAFSVSGSRISPVKNYIANQHTHHKNFSFKDEFRKFLKQYNVEYDERYVWD